MLPTVTQSSDFSFFLRGQELGYEISCLLDVTILACSVSHVGSQLFVMLLCLKTYIWAAYPLVASHI